jgi:N-acetylmuramoyl-L-alanine amidase
MVHCLATPPSWGEGKTAEQMVAEVRLWHTRGRGWSDIAYAEIIDYDGHRAKGRDLNRDGNTFDDTGAGAGGHNSDTIHLALAGGRWPDGRWGERTDAFSDHFTPEQDHALRSAIIEINRLAGRKLKVLGHNEVDPNKGCPAFDVQGWLRAASPAAPATNPLARLLTAIFKALGLGKGGPA